MASDDRGELRILFFAPDGLPTFRPDVDALFGKYLAREGIRTDLVTVGEAGQAWGGGAALLASRRVGRVRRRLAVVGNDLRRLLALRDVSAIQVRDKPIFAGVALIVAKLRGIPAFYWMSYPTAEAELRRARLGGPVELGWIRYLALVIAGAFGKAMLRATLSRFDHIFAQSDQMAAHLSRQGVRRERISVVPMGIDPERFPASTPPAPADTLRLCYLGGCDRIRRVDLLFEALAIIRPALPGVELRIVGDCAEPADRRWLEHRAAACSVGDCVTITGWLPQAQAQALVADADICLSPLPPDPILDQGTPTKLVEYMALARPVIASVHPDQSAVIADSGGGVCVDWDAQAWAEAILGLAGDVEMRFRMGERGRDYVLRHRNYARLAPAVAATYHALCGRSTASNANTMTRSSCSTGRSTSERL